MSEPSPLTSIIDREFGDDCRYRDIAFDRENVC